MRDRLGFIMRARRVDASTRASANCPRVRSIHVIFWLSCVNAKHCLRLIQIATPGIFLGHCDSQAMLIWIVSFPPRCCSSAFSVHCVDGGQT